MWSLLIGIFILVTSAAFFGLTFALLKTARSELLDIALLFILLIWQLGPILFEGYSPGLNFREVARYPISFRLYFPLTVAYGASDSVAITCSIWLLCMWVGVLVARPDLALAAAFAFLLFAIFNLLCNRIIVGLFERFQSTRKGRERIVFLTLILLLTPQLLQFSARAWLNGHAFKLPSSPLPTLARVRDFLPSGLTAHIFLFAGPNALQAIAGLLLITGFVLLLLFRQLRAVFQGEIYSEAYTVHRELTVRPGLAGARSG